MHHNVQCGHRTFQGANGSGHLGQTDVRIIEKNLSVQVRAIHVVVVAES